MIAVNKLKRSFAHGVVTTGQIKRAVPNPLRGKPGERLVGKLGTKRRVVAGPDQQALE